MDCELIRWKDTIKEFLDPCCYKFATDICICVKAVDAELKPSYMFDFAFVSPQRIIPWLNQLHDVHLIHCRLSVISIEEQIFIVKRSAIKRRMSEIGRGNEQIIVADVSSDLQQPQSTSTTLCQTIVQHYAKAVSEKLLTWNTDDAFTLELSPDVNRSTVFGLLLGYPVVYWYSDVTGADNCLSHVPLQLIRITAVDSTTTRDSEPTVIYSFTVPEQLYSHCHSQIDSWQKQLFTAALRPCIDWNYSLNVDCKTVVQSVVCM